MQNFLRGITILDVGTFTPGKYATFLLSEYGAETLRIERPIEEPGPVSNEDLLLNRGKRSLTLNLRDSDGRAIFERLAETADVIIESNRPGVTKRLGIDYESLRARNQRLIYCSLSGFGQTGPRAQQPAYDLMFMAQSGILHAVSGSGQAPQPPRAFLADAVSGLVAAFAINTALLARERAGTGSYVDLAMLDSIFSLLAVSHGTEGESGASAGQESEAFAAMPLYNVYNTADGRYIALSVGRPSSLRALFEYLGQPGLAAKASEPDGGGEEIAAMLRDTFAKHPAQHWIEALQPLDVEISHVNTPQEALADAQLLARGMVREFVHPQAGRLRQIDPPFRLGAYDDVAASQPAPVIGQHTDQVLGEQGYDAAAIAELRERGVV